MKIETLVSTLAILVGAMSMPSAEAQFADERLAMPTYTPGGYEKTPVFYTGRVYQGAQGRVYPYPAQDVLHDQKHDETYRYLTLENPWLQMGVLPEHGGHLLNLTDKATGFETFYRQHVVKPALIGMLGAWISGGIEWNFPHHHRPTSSMPVDWRHTKRPDGTDTIWVGETELTAGLKWTIGLSLLKDRAVLQAENIFMNRSPRIESMLYWANVAVHCNPDYRVIFPPSCHLGFDHHKASWTSFPIGSVGTSGEPGVKARNDDDLSLWKNHVHHSRSIFAWDPDNAWLAGYDHGKDAGTVHVSNRHITFGKKFFLWGNFPGAFAWDEVLTDEDGPYLELMVGCWSDNQPDYSWIAPYETRRVSQFWYPVKGIGNVKNATIDGAVNVERLAPEQLRVGFHSTRELAGCRITLTENGRTVFEEKDVAIGPNRPWCRTLAVTGVAKDQAFEGTLFDADGKTVIAYRPVLEDPHDPLPEKVANPQFPEEITSAETAYLTGLRLDQFKNGLIDPLPYYRRALAIDPGYSAANLMLGYHAMNELRYAEAEAFFKAAADRANRNYTRAKDVEPEYMQALACRVQGRLKEAEDLFWRVTWRSTLKREAYVEIARLACLRGDWQEADARIDDALDLGRREAKLHVIKAYVRRRLGDKASAKRELDEAFACDPLENWGAAERGFLNGNPAERIVTDELKDRGLRGQQLIETLCDYAGLGAWEEVVALAGAAEALGAREKSVAAGSDDLLPIGSAVAACGSLKSPMFAYFRGWALGKLGRDAEAKRAFALAAAQPGERCFPSRPEEYEALKAADAVAPAANTSYYLGEILTFRDRKDDALAFWRKAVREDPKHALAWRGIGFLLSHPGTYFVNTGVPRGVASDEALACYRKALAADPSNAHVLLEYDELAELMKLPDAQRLKELEARRDVASKYDPVLTRLADLMTAAGRFDEALDILRSRRFYVWEGGKELLVSFTDAALGSARVAFAAGDYAKALERCELAMTYPSNLQAAKGADAGVAPEACLLMAEIRRAQRDPAGERQALQRALAGWSRPGAMNACRIEAMKALAKLDGKAVDAAAVKFQAEQLDLAIAKLEKPLSRELHASRKFFSGGTVEEAEAANLREAAKLRERKAKALQGTDLELTVRGWRPAERWRGFNLLEMFIWRPNSPKPAFLESDFRFLRDNGFNFVRLPIDYRFWTHGGDWTKIDEEWVKPVDEAIALGQKYGVHVQINLHRAPGYCVNRGETEPKKLFGEGKEEARQVFARHWAFLAKRYAALPNARVSFDLVNEPPDVSEEEYVAGVKDAVAAIRAVTPDRLVFSDGRRWGNTPTHLLADDPNIAQAMRGYLPMTVSHYLANWVKLDPNVRPVWPQASEGSKTKYDDPGREWLYRNNFKAWDELAAKGVFVMMGEFGVYNKTPHATSLALLEDNLRMLKERGWGWAIWNLRGTFGPVDSERTDVEYETVDGHKIDRKMLELLKRY